MLLLLAGGVYSITSTTQRPVTKGVDSLNPDVLLSLSLSFKKKLFNLLGPRRVRERESRYCAPDGESHP